MAYIAKADGTTIPIGTPVTLEKAQEIVGGYVEVVHPRHTPGCVFLCDEEGLLKNKPINRHGCFLYGTGEITDHPIVGDIIVFQTRKEAKGWSR